MCSAGNRDRKIHNFVKSDKKPRFACISQAKLGYLTLGDNTTVLRSDLVTMKAYTEFSHLVCN